MIKVFMTMLAVKERDHVVRMNAYNLAQLAKKTEAEVLQALKVLSEPDRKRLQPQPNDGRRIAKVDGGWLILNGQKYQDEMVKCFQRAKTAERVRAWRARHGSHTTLAERLAEKEARES